MSAAYEEIVEGERILRLPPGPRHEEICARLHRRVGLATAELASTRLLRPRERIEISKENVIHPDLALVTTANAKLWLAAEVIDSNDHHADTVAKKSLYQDLKIPRLWMIDPRYDNVEVYHATAHGMTLKRILTGRELLTDSLLPGFQLPVHELFAGRLFDESGPLNF